MLILSGANQKLQLVTGTGSGSIRYATSQMRNNAGTVTPESTAYAAAITTATTTDIVAAAGSSQQLNVKFVSVFNDHASVSNLCTLQVTDSTNTEPLCKITLAPGESLILDQTGTITYYDANGIPKVTLAPVTSPFIMATASLVGTAVAGYIEYDGKVHYATPVASERGVLSAEEFIRLTAAYTLTSQTGAQKLFNSPTNGAVTVGANRTYQFECIFDLTAMSASAGAFGFALGGTATLTRQKWLATANKATLATQLAWQSSLNTAANTAISASTTGPTVAAAHIRGILTVGAGGTIIPQVSLAVAAAAVVSTDSFFRIWPVGADTVQSVGNWS